MLKKQPTQSSLKKPKINCFIRDSNKKNMLMYKKKRIPHSSLWHSRSIWKFSFRPFCLMYLKEKLTKKKKKRKHLS